MHLRPGGSKCFSKPTIQLANQGLVNCVNNGNTNSAWTWMHWYATVVRILCSYLDQGISLWSFPTGDQGFLAAIKTLESNGFSSFFKTAKARKLLLQDQCDIQHLLALVVGNSAYYEQYLFDQQFSHQGWSGIVAALEDNPEALLDRRAISLQDVITFELLLEIDALEAQLGRNSSPLCDRVKQPPVHLFAAVEATEIQEVFALWQDAFEWDYYDQVLAGLAKGQGHPSNNSIEKSFQAIFASTNGNAPCVVTLSK